MKRTPPKDLSLMPKRVEFDPKKAYQKKQLAEIGTVSIIWNQMEATIDFLGSHILFFTSPFYVKLGLVNALNLTSKIELLRVCAKHPKILDDKAKSCIESALLAVIEYRTYRNAVIHHQIYDHKKGIGLYINERGKPSQILVSFEALSALSKRLIILKQELIEIDLLFRLELSPPGSIQISDPKTGKPVADLQRALREQAVPEQTRRVLRYQKERLSLPQLPLFPDARRVRPKKVDAKSRRRSSEKDRA